MKYHLFLLMLCTCLELHAVGLTPCTLGLTPCTLGFTSCTLGLILHAACCQAQPAAFSLWRSQTQINLIFYISMLKHYIEKNKADNWKALPLIWRYLRLSRKSAKCRLKLAFGSCCLLHPSRCLFHLYFCLLHPLRCLFHLLCYSFYGISVRNEIRWCLRCVYLDYYNFKNSKITFCFNNFRGLNPQVLTL